MGFNVGATKVRQRWKGDVDRLYFAVDNLVYMYDTSTPGSPLLRGWWTAPSTILDLEARGDLAYVVYGQTMVVLDFQQPLVPQVIGELAQLSYDPWTLFDIKRAGDTAYLRRILDWDTKDVLAVDVSDPTQPSVLSSAEIVGDPKDLALFGEFALVNSGTHFLGVRIHDRKFGSRRIILLEVADAVEQS